MMTEREEKKMKNLLEYCVINGWRIFYYLMPRSASRYQRTGLTWKTE